MKPMLEYLPRQSDESFATRFFDYHFYPTPWHFHPEYELVLVTESSGKRFIGNQVSDFKPGDMALIGPYLPHTYKNSEPYFRKGSTLRARSIVVHFREDSFGRGFVDLPEAQPVKALLARSFKGLDISGRTNLLVSRKLHALMNARGLTRWLTLMQILHMLAESDDLTDICPGEITARNENETIRMNKIIDFVIRNFHREITLPEAAAIANMAENSFSRYFSQRTRKSFTSFVNEVRLNHASKLLIETEKAVTSIGLECGFNNLSNFNRQFRKLYNKNPVTFRKQYVND